MKNSSKRILLSEDDLFMRILIKKYLENLDFEVWETDNGLSALVKISENGLPDLVITDVMMPEMNGYELMKNIQKENKSIPIIGMSAGKFKSGEDVDFTEKIEKPFMMENLKQLIEKHI